MQTEQTSLDQAYRDDLERNPYNIKNWSYYLEFKKEALPEERFKIYDEALSYLPRSYKLWKAYLQEYEDAIGEQSVLSPMYQGLNKRYEQSILYLETMPVLWSKYLTFLLKQPFLITHTRVVFNRALRSLPITQHLRWIWPLYLQFAEQCGVPATSASIWKRFLAMSIDNQYLEDYITALVTSEQWDKAAVQYARLLDLPNFTSRHNRTRYEVWTDYLKLIVHHSKDIVSVDCEQVIRGGLQRYPLECAMLWCALSEMFIRQGHLERARAVYLEALDYVFTLRDLTTVYEAYTKFELAFLESIQAMIESHEDLPPEQQSPSHLQLLLDEFSLYECQLRSVAASRELCINNVLLRQNPHSINEWQVRIRLYHARYDKLRKAAADADCTTKNHGDGPSPDHLEKQCSDALMAVLHTYTAAIDIVDPALAIGRYHDLWVSLANFYLSHDQPEDARAVYERALTRPMQSTRAMAYVCCCYAEMEIVLGFPQRARIILQRVLMTPASQKHPHQSSSSTLIDSVDGQVARTPQDVSRELSLWSLYADLTESICSFEVTKQVYETIIQRKLHNPAFLLHYIHLLLEHKLYDEAFKKYEQGVRSFPYPLSAPLWLSYLQNFIRLHSHDKPLRVRDLFRDAIQVAPMQYKKAYYLLFIRFEQDYGTPRQLLRVIHEACKVIEDKDEKYMFYCLYINKMAENYGLDQTRPIFAEALEVVEESVLPTLGLMFARLEIHLGQIIRAREIFSYVGQSCDPGSQTQFWKAFEQFETSYGTIDTFKEMLRLKRTTGLKYTENALIREAIQIQKNQQQQEKEKHHLTIIQQTKTNTKSI